jgi:hypothetical protein
LTVLFRLHLTKILLVIAGEFVHLICRKLWKSCVLHQQHTQLSRLSF